MKQAALIRHLESSGCKLYREGRSHLVYVNILMRKVSTIPRSSEINLELVRRICRDLDIPDPAGLTESDKDFSSRFPAFNDQ
jgi:predicted RNA binding protein YcfA (HicA-like mRNA interferase family)